MIDWQASKVDWINDVRTILLPQLRADRRLVGLSALEQNFDNSVAAWQARGDFRPVINCGNELAAAAALLPRLAENAQLQYERRLLGTGKSIDFCVQAENGTVEWIDMKTIAPGWQDDADAWARLMQIAVQFPDNAQLIVDRQFGGAAIGLQAMKARWGFVQRTVEFERKLTLLSESEHGPARLLLCSEGSWHEDDLEDFADFYFTGHFREDDWAQNAVARHMSERNLAFTGTVTGFLFLHRGHDELFARHFSADVRGPSLFGPEDEIAA
jgi:hypothetical protein